MRMLTNGAVIAVLPIRRSAHPERQPIGVADDVILTTA
jgi:hypothetical protein